MIEKKRAPLHRTMNKKNYAATGIYPIADF